MSNQEHGAMDVKVEEALLEWVSRTRIIVPASCLITNVTIQVNSFPIKEIATDLRSLSSGDRIWEVLSEWK